jgi:hypothetical protein
LKRIILIGLSVLIILTGLMTISCKNDSKESESKEAKKPRVLDDSTFVELAARQNLLFQEYYIKAQQIRSDSQKVILSNEFNKETEKILSEHGISRDQLNNYLDEMLSDTQKTLELQGKIVTRVRELVSEKSNTENQ